MNKAIFKSKKFWWIFGGVVLFVATSVALITVDLMRRIDYTIAENLTFEVNSEKKVSELFTEVSGEIADEALDTAEVGEKTFAVVINGKLGAQKVVEVSYEVVDTTPPVIEGDEEVEIFKNETLDIVGNYKIKDNSLKEIEGKMDGECDTAVVGTCEVKIVAVDAEGNRAEKIVKVNVVVNPEEETVASRSRRGGYYIRVNRSQNVVMVYGVGSSGEYDNLVATFVASTGGVGSETPLGTFTVSDRYEALYLVGDVWGHYATRIYGPYFFHSVPYFTKGSPHWDNLEYLEYNKLGAGASAGCVRLAVRDAKWVYDNIPAGTTVEIYDGELPAGVVKPTPIRIDVNDTLKRGWDPTDTDVESPWR